MVIARGTLAGVEGTVVRPVRLFGQDAYLLDLRTGAPRWAAIRRTRVAAWALERAGLDPGQTERLRWRRRVATVQVVLALMLPLVIAAWGRLPALGLVLGVGWLVAMLALVSVARHHQGPGPAGGTGP